MYWKVVTRNLRKSSPGRSWGRNRTRGSGRAERIIDADLVPTTTRHSRFLDSRERAARAMLPVWVVVLATGILVAYLMAGA